MGPPEQAGLEPAREQVIYANLLLLGVWVGMFVLIATFGLYVLGVIPAHVPPAETPRNWGQGVDGYQEATGWPHGWSWLGMLHKGDVLNYVGLVLLAGLTVLGYSVLLVAYAKQGDRLFSIICVLEILVLCLAASGVLVSGGH